MNNEKLQRGERVLYNGKIYYFQPNGSSCYLYRRKKDVGIRDLAACTAAKTSVSRPVKRETAAFTQYKKPKADERIDAELDVAELTEELANMVIDVRNLEIKVERYSDELTQKKDELYKLSTLLIAETQGKADPVIEKLSSDFDGRDT